MNGNIKSEIRALRENSGIAYVASVNEEGYPQRFYFIDVKNP